MKGVQLSFIIYSTRLSMFGSILAYVLLGNNITAEKVFVLTSFYSILRQTMTVFFPQGIGQVSKDIVKKGRQITIALLQVAETLVSINRLNKFMQYEETETVKSLKSDKENGIKGQTVLPKSLPNLGKLWRDTKRHVIMLRFIFIGIYVTNATAKWSETSAENTLSNISVSVGPGTLLAVIGPVGSGKSSLLHLILRELPLISGELEVNGEISYASQEPWLFAGMW